MMNKIYKRAYMRKGQERSPLEYAAVLTDGKDIIAIDTIGYQIPVRKSRLIPRQEQLVFDMIKTTKPETFNFDGRQVEKEYHILSMEPELIHGLTRKERNLKQVLMIALDQLRTANNLEELRYWLTEWDPNNTHIYGTWTKTPYGKRCMKVSNLGGANGMKTCVRK